MKYNPVRATGRPPQRNRRSIRLQGYDYSQPGAYFITMCTQNRECLFGNIVDGRMMLNEYGKIVRDEWMQSGKIRNEIQLDEWVIMPNHVHAIVMIRRGDRPVAPATPTVAPATPTVALTPTAAPKMPGPRPKSIGSLLAGFKSAATGRINNLRNTPGTKLWQRNYYEHIIRNETELQKIREYIINNPQNWFNDEHYLI